MYSAKCIVPVITIYISGPCDHKEQLLHNSWTEPLLPQVDAHGHLLEPLHARPQQLR